MTFFVRTDTTRRRCALVGVSSECGAAFVWVMCVCALVWAAALAFLVIGVAAATRHRAAAAADLAALAAAEALHVGVPPPCDAAAAIVAAYGGRVAECVVEATSVLVVAEVSHGAPWPKMPPARARARAGYS